MKDVKKVRKFPAKGVLVAAACITTILCSGIAVNAATDGAVADGIIKFTDSLGITHTYEFSNVDGEAVTWTAKSENADDVTITAESENADADSKLILTEDGYANKTDEEKIKDSAEYLQSDEYKLDDERHKLLDEYAKKGEGSYSVTDSKGNRYTITVDADGTASMESAESNE